MINEIKIKQYRNIIHKTIRYQMKTNELINKCTSIIYISINNITKHLNAMDNKNEPQLNQQQHYNIAKKFNYYIKLKHKINLANLIIITKILMIQEIIIK